MLTCALACSKQYGSKKQKKKVLVVSKVPLARYRPEYDTTAQHVTSFCLPSGVIAQVAGHLAESRELGKYNFTMNTGPIGMLGRRVAVCMPSEYRTTGELQRSGKS